MQHPRRILIADDEKSDIVLLRLALQRSRSKVELLAAADGREAIEMLQVMDENKEVLPLLLLDLHMPGMDGFQVLEWLRADPRWNWLPVLVLTSSDHPEDRRRSLALGAREFLVKPLKFEKLVLLMEELENRYFDLPLALAPTIGAMGTGQRPESKA